MHSWLCGQCVLLIRAVQLALCIFGLVDMNKKEAVSMFDALASELRLDIVKLLVRFGEDGLVVGEIGSQLAIPPTNLSFHLKALSHSGLIYAEQEGRFQRYRANTSALAGLVSYLMAECCVQQSTPRIGSCESNK